MKERVEISLVDEATVILGAKMLQEYLSRLQRFFLFADRSQRLRTGLASFAAPALGGATRMTIEGEGI